jgi:hypothetical protein
MSRPRPAPVPNEDDPRTPKAPEAERLLLQFMVTHPGCVPDVLEAGFQPEDCYHHDYREVARLTLDLHARHVPPHWHLVGAALKTSDVRLDDPLAFEGFDDGVPRPDAAGVVYFVNVLKDRAQRRQVLLATAKARSAVANPDVPLAETMATFEADVRQITATSGPGADGLPPEGLADATDVAAEGRALAATGVEYVVDGIVPNYGMVGMNVAYAKVGKTTFGHALGAAVATGRTFLDRDVRQARVLALAPEDPPEYTAYLARHLSVPARVMTFYRGLIRFDDAGLDAIAATVTKGGYGLVQVSSWQAVVAGLVKDENDNAGAVAVVERVKAAARATGVPWLIDAHSGKGEDQSDTADPTRALRGASAAAGAADYMLSLRYADSPFSSQRRLSGKGRFVSLEPVLLEYDLTTGTFTALGDGKAVATESTWLRICEVGVLHGWASVDAIAMAAGFVTQSGRVSGHSRRLVREALRGRGLDSKTETRRGQQTTVYRLPAEEVR